MCAETPADERQRGAGAGASEGSARVFYSHLKISEVAGEMDFLLSLPLSFPFSFGCFKLFSPRNVHKMKDFQCFSALIILIIQHPTSSQEKG